MKKAVIFDLDGTLLNTLKSIAQCANAALEKFGLPSVEQEIYPQFVGHGAQALIRGVFKFVHADSEIFNDFQREFLEIYNKNGADNISVYPGIFELLQELRKREIKTAVLSNKPHAIVKHACAEFFPNMFDVVYGQRDNIPAKPDPFMVRKILNELNVSVKDCIYCGDSGVDIDTGRNAGALTLGAAWGFYSDTQFAKADGILKFPQDMLGYIKL